MEHNYDTSKWTVLMISVIIIIIIKLPHIANLSIVVTNANDESKRTTTSLNSYNLFVACSILLLLL